MGRGRVHAPEYQRWTRERAAHRGRRGQGQGPRVLHPPIPPAGDLEGRPSGHAGRPHLRARRFLRELDRMATLAVMPEVAGALFYERLFAANPGFQRLFKNDMRIQGVKLMATLAMIVYNLPEPSRIL